MYFRGMNLLRRHYIVNLNYSHFSRKSYLTAKAEKSEQSPRGGSTSNLYSSLPQVGRRRLRACVDHQPLPHLCHVLLRGGTKACWMQPRLPAPLSPTGEICHESHQGGWALQLRVLPGDRSKSSSPICPRGWWREGTRRAQPGRPHCPPKPEGEGDAALGTHPVLGFMSDISTLLLQHH